MRPNQNNLNRNNRAVKNSNAGKPASSPAQRSPAEQRNIRDYLLMIRERWFLGLAAAVVLVGGLAFLQLRKDPVYEARASLLFEPSSISVVDIEQVVDNSLQGSGTAADTRLQTHIGQMMSNTFFQYAVESFTE